MLPKQTPILIILLCMQKILALPQWTDNAAENSEISNFINEIKSEEGQPQGFTLNWIGGQLPPNNLSQTLGNVNNGQTTPEQSNPGQTTSNHQNSGSTNAGTQLQNGGLHFGAPSKPLPSNVAAQLNNGLHPISTPGHPAPIVNIAPSGDECLINIKTSNELEVATAKATVINATVTTYADCGSVPGACGFAASGTAGTGAFSSYLQNASSNGYCGTCWKFVAAKKILGSNSDHTCAEVPITQPLVVMISNTCGYYAPANEVPPQTGNGIGLCNQDEQTPLSMYYTQTDLDLCRDTEAATIWNTISGGPVGIVVLQQVACPGNWDGTTAYTASWADYQQHMVNGLETAPTGGGQQIETQ